MNDIQKKIQEELKNLQTSKVAKQTDAQLYRGDFLANMAKEQATDPAWLEANKEGAEKRTHDINWQQNHKAALDRINGDEAVSVKRNKKIKEVTSSAEWKNNQLEGCRTKRANNPNWKSNIKKGFEKLKDDPNYIETRKKVAAKLTGNDDFRNSVKEGVKDRWLKEENLTACPHCGKTVDNANYKRWHGDKCKSKP